MRKLLFALLAIITLASCGKMKQPEFRTIENVKMEKGNFSLSKAGVVLYVKFYNPNSFNAKLAHAKGDVWVDSSYLGHFTVDEKIKIRGKSEFTVPVRLTLDLHKLMLESSLAKRDKEKKEIFIEAKGTIRAGRSGFYKNFPFHYIGEEDFQKILMDATKKPSAD